MALQFSTAYRNVFLDDLATTLGGSEVIKIFTGSVPVNCAAANTGTMLVEFDLAGSGDWGAASGGQITLSSLPLSAVAAAGAPSNAGYFRMFDSGAACHMQGTVTATGGGGDMILDNVSIATGQNVNITQWTLTAPGA